MGAVWVARHVTLGSQLAVKFLDPKLAASPSFVARFEREARAAASIRSPHVVQVHDFGVDDGIPYIAMELLHGEDLRSRIRRMGRLSLATTSGLLLQVGKGLRRAHEAGIVHRDIKPGNLFLARVDDDEILKVLDFGIAKEPDSKLDDHTRTGELIGSPHYVSPEQARGERDVDHRSDVWSLGVIAFRMVTGELPFPGDGLGKVLSKVLVDPPPPVRSLVPELPESLDAFFTRALAKKREERFGSVRELVDAFVTLAQAEQEEDSIAPPSWSTIVSVSIPPAPPHLEVAAAAAGAIVGAPDTSGAVSGAPGTNVPVAGAPGTNAPVAEQLQAKVPVVAVAEACVADAGPKAAEEEAPVSEGKRDSLMPSMGPKVPPLYPHPLLRLRWMALGALAASALVTIGVNWSHDHSAAGGAGTESPPGPAMGSEPHLRGPEAPPPPSSAPPPSAGSSDSAPGSSAATSMTAKATSAPVSSSPPPSRSAGVVAPGAPPAATGGTRRKWGF
jgi:serine/threonine-protein kinase